MKTRGVIVVAVLWVASLFGAALWAQGGAGANQQPAPAPVFRNGDPIGPVITGENLGFQRVAGTDPDGRVLGRLVVRVDGRWRETAVPTMIIR